MPIRSTKVANCEQVFDTGVMGLGAQVARVASSGTATLPSARPIGPSDMAGGDLAGVTPLLLARERVLPVDEQVRDLLPSGGLQRGSTIGVGGAGGSISLAFALMAEAARQGSWIAVLGAESLGLAAIHECGVPLQQVVLIDNVRESESAWADVLGALVDGFDLVVIMGGTKQPRITASTARRLTARTRDRGAILFSIGRPLAAMKPDVQLTVTDAQWAGMGQGHGYLRSRRATVVVSGRRKAASHRTFSLCLPDETGQIRRASDGDRFAGSDIDALVAASEAADASAATSIVVDSVEPQAGRAHLRVV